MFKDSECSIGQALTMIETAGIELRGKQVKQYVRLRERSSKKERIGLSDQEVLYLVLDEGQKEKFREGFDHIDFG